MNSPEPHLQMAQRHIAECEALVEQQKALLGELAQHGLDTARAEGLLAFFEDKLRLMREDLIRKQAHAASNSDQQ